MKKIFFLSRYGEVFWQMMDPVPLDPDLVAKFNDKTMAIVGYESNQVLFRYLIHFRKKIYSIIHLGNEDRKRRYICPYYMGLQSSL